jgi:hypothetical protein
MCAILHKALCIMFAALKKSDISFISQPVRAGHCGGHLLLCHWVSSANVLTHFMAQL